MNEEGVCVCVCVPHRADMDIKVDLLCSTWICATNTTDKHEKEELVHLQ